MYFILEEMQIELGDTPIDNIFINDYMPRRRYICKSIPDGIQVCQGQAGF